jgi:hypothetical protein
LFWLSHHIPLFLCPSLVPAFHPVIVSVEIPAQSPRYESRNKKI